MPRAGVLAGGDFSYSLGRKEHPGTLLGLDSAKIQTAYRYGSI